jgi:hypothetical protein
MQQTLQTPTRQVCEVAVAFHNSAIEHGGLSNSKKEFFTFVPAQCLIKKDTERGETGVAG